MHPFTVHVGAIVVLLIGYSILWVGQYVYDNYIS